jgi:hypothetical protein
VGRAPSGQAALACPLFLTVRGRRGSGVKGRRRRSRSDASEASALDAGGAAPQNARPAAPGLRAPTMLRQLPGVPPPVRASPSI